MTPQATAPNAGAPAGFAQGGPPPTASLAELTTQCERQNNASACTQAGLQSKRASDGPNAVKAFDRGCSLGDAASCAESGAIRIGGKLVPRDLPVAGERFGKACELGVATVCPIAATLSPDPNKRRALVKQGCDHKDGASCAALGRIMIESGGSGVTDGRSLLERSCADTQDPRSAGMACSELGHTYELGEGVAVDIKKAVDLYKKACDLNPWTCSMLGDAYLRGSGVEKSKPKAKELYSKACSAGSDDGCDALQSIDKDQSFGGLHAQPTQ